MIKVVMLGRVQVQVSKQPKDSDAKVAICLSFVNPKVCVLWGLGFEALGGVLCILSQPQGTESTMQTSFLVARPPETHYPSKPQKALDSRPQTSNPSSYTLSCEALCRSDDHCRCFFACRYPSCLCRFQPFDCRKR